MLGWYGQAQGGGSCAGDFGADLAARWRGMKKTNCVPTGPSSVAVMPISDSASGANDGGPSTATSASGGRSRSTSTGRLGSSIDCYLVHQTRHHGFGDNLCHMRNVAVDLSLFADDARTRPVVRKYVDTRHAAQPYIKFPAGFIQGDCTPDPSVWEARSMPGWNADLTVSAYQQLPPTQHPDGAAVCDEWVEHPVLVTERDTFANFFHDSEDFFNVFLAMAVLEWKPQEVQMYLTDLYPQGPFWYASCCC
jgi:hypothetical protein